MSATVKSREMLRTDQVDDMHYDASEEESISEMDTIHLENALPILDAPRSQQRSGSEMTLKTLSGKRAFRPRPVRTGYSTSDDEDIDSSGVVTRGKRKAIVVKRHASWPRLPLTPKGQDSGVQGLDDSETDAGSTDGNDGNAEHETETSVRCSELNARRRREWRNWQDFQGYCGTGF